MWFYINIWIYDKQTTNALAYNANGGVQSMEVQVTVDITVIQLAYNYIILLLLQ